MDELLTWIRHDPVDTHSHTFISPDIVVRESEVFGRGIFAEGALKPSLILRIPHNFLVNFTTVVRHITRYNPSINLDNNPVYSVINLPYEGGASDDVTSVYSHFELATLHGLTSFQLIGMFLTLEARRPKSFWQPFLSMLPGISDFEEMPLVHYVRGTLVEDDLPVSTRTHAAKVAKRFDDDYEVVSALVAPWTTIDREDFLLSWLCINSRCLYMEVPQGTTAADNFTMAPYVDFINHSCQDQCKLKIDGRGFQVYTTTSYKPDEQLFLSYGPHSNEFLLCEYGFVMATNTWNDLDVTHLLLPRLERSGYHRDWLRDNDYYGDYTIGYDGSPSFRTEVALAVLQEDRPDDSRRLNAFVSGYTDGAVYQRGSSSVLSGILYDIVDEVIPQGASSEIKQLYRDRKEIARKGLALLESS
ncbi:ribosomal lysine N-methyltransferase 2 [Diutina catenulata]